MEQPRRSLLAWIVRSDTQFDAAYVAVETFRLHPPVAETFATAQDARDWIMGEAEARGLLVQWVVEAV